MTNYRVSLLAAAALFASAASSAHANSIAIAPERDAYAEAPGAPWGGSQRVEGRLGMLLGGSDVGDANGFAMGVSAGLGYRVGDVTLRGLFDHFKVGDGGNEAMNRNGRSTRIGGALRYSLVNNGSHTSFGVDFWGELGVGYEHVAWRQGGVLDRPSGEIAIGFEVDARGDEKRPGRRRHLGWFMAFRTLFAEGPEMEGPAVCGGPCDRATKPSRLDLSMFWEVGLHWGR